MNPISRQFCAAYSRLFRSGLAAAFVLCLVAITPPVLAEIVDVKPSVADDVGNWSTTVVKELIIRVDEGYSGMKTTGIQNDEVVDDKGSPGKTSHPQHIVRLPNKEGPDGQWHAYFAITHSADWGTFVSGGGDGYWMVAEIDAENYSEAIDRISTHARPAAVQPNVADVATVTEGQYVYEEHFTTDALLSPNCIPRPCVDGKITYSDAGDWNHPAAMATMGDALLMVAQQYPATIPVYGDTLVVGDSADALLFYDVSAPWAPEYVGKLDVCDLGFAPACLNGPLENEDKNDPNATRNIMSTLGLAYFENGTPNGWYHLSVGNGSTKNNNYYCEEGANCFKEPLVDRWKDLGASVGPKGEQNAGGQQGQIIHSREMYSSAPAPGEPCYKQDGTRLGTLGGDEENTICSPPGVQRAIRSYASTGAFLGGSFVIIGDSTTNVFQNSVQGRCWPYDKCSSALYASTSLNVFRSDHGIPIFLTLGYKKDDGLSSVLSPGPGANTWDAASASYRRETGRPGRDFVMTQLSGQCGPNNGTHVDNNGDVTIYCVSESDQGGICALENNDPVHCNRIYANSANGATSYGVIRIIEPGGKQIIYRGRGLTDVEFLNEPPWGPGRNPDNSLKDPNAVDWALMLETPGTNVRVLRGNWAYYSEKQFGGPSSYLIGPSVFFPGYTIDGGTTPFLRSLRVLPERGIALFDDPLLRGRMVSAVESVPNLVRYCGDDFQKCLSLNQMGPDSDGSCDFALKLSGGLWNCTFPRTIWDKTSSVRVKHEPWAIYGDENYNDALQGTVWSGTGGSEYAAGFSGGRSILKLPRGNCANPQTPVILFEATYPFGDSRPLLSWNPLTNTTTYQIFVERQDGAILFNDLREVCQTQTCRNDPPRFMPSHSLTPGETYRWRVRGINRTESCYREGAFSDYQLITIAAPAVQVTLTTQTNDPSGIGTGSIDFASGSDVPVSNFGTNYFNLGSVVTFVATAAPDSEFVSWAGDAASCGTATTCEITITGALNVQAVFRPKPRLYRDPRGAVGTITPNPVGFECENTSGYGCNAYSTGSTVSMTAAAVPGESIFIGWGGDADCTDDDDNDGNPLTSRVTMDENKSCAAIFTRSNYNLEVSSAGGGTVAGSDTSGALSCDPQGQACSKTYAAGIDQLVSLTATPDAPDFRFVRWYGHADCWSAANGEGKNNTIEVTAGSSDVSCRAMFVDVNGVYTLNVAKQGTGASASTITAVITAPTPADLPDINCGLPACTTEVPSTTTVQLTAKPVRGARFDGWFGSSPLCELPRILIPDPDNVGFFIEIPDPNPVITVNMADAAVLLGDLSCRANFSSKVLLVDGSDDDQLRAQYDTVLRLLGEGAYAYWPILTSNDVINEPTAADLAPYSRVIWYTGSNFEAKDPPPPAGSGSSYAAGPSPTAEAELAAYLDDGGCFMLSSAEYSGDRGLTSFATNYLGVQTVTDDIVATEITGSGTLRGFSSFAKGSLNHGDAGLSAVSSTSDGFLASSEPGTNRLFRYTGSGIAGVSRDNGVYRSVILGFPILALPSIDPDDFEFDGRDELVGTFLDYCLQIEKDDEFEINDDGVAGSTRSDIDDQLATRLQGDVNLTELKVLPGNEDWYRWESSIQGDTRFEILFSHDSGDLNFDFYEGNGRDPIDSIQSVDDNELRDFRTVPVASGGGSNYYYMRVYGVGSASNSYTLRINTEFIDTDEDGISNYTDTDDDGDGMSDDYEIQNGLDPLVADDAFFDPDGDGYTNLEEHVGGSDPNDAASVPTPPATLGTQAFFDPPKSCSPSIPSYLCSPVSLPWLGILLGVGE